MNNTTTYLLVAALVVGSAASAAAQDEASETRLEGLAFRLEAGLGTMLAEPQRRYRGFDTVGLESTVRVAYSPVDALAVQLSVGYWWFRQRDTNTSVAPTRGNPNGSAIPLTIGLRLEPRVHDRGRMFLDVNTGVAFTGGLVRYALDVGLGFEFEVNETFQVGPYLRYAFVLHKAEPTLQNADAQFWAGGVSLTVRPWANPPALRAELNPDPDGDGILGALDGCPNIAEDFDGFRDEDGCPDRDNDGDGILDEDDGCPLVPETLNGFQDEDGCPDEPDPDRDGILGDADLCPGNAEDFDGFRDDDGCPERDNDGDGILDAVDACPNDAETVNGYLDHDGCPDLLPDTDHDGIPNNRDRCPDEPETFNGHLDEDGCPDGSEVARIGANGIEILQEIRFATDSASIVGRRSELVLDAVASILRAHREIQHVDVQGHTDDQGDNDHNLELSRARSAAVVEALVRRGVDSGRLRSSGYGESQQLCDPSSLRGRALAACRTQNRRVVFLTLSQPQVSD